MKLKIRNTFDYKKAGGSAQHRDKLHSKKLHKSFDRISQQRRRQQLKDQKRADALARNTRRLEENPPKTRVTLNVVGDRRGMMYKDDSAHMRKIRGMRRIYNKQMPVLACNGCAFQNVCPQFKAGYECAFLPFLNSHKVETEQDLIEYMKELLGVSMRRTHQAMMMETLSGAAPSLENTEALGIVFNQFKDFHTLVSQQTSLSIETDDNSVIGRLFGGLENLVNKTKKAQAKPIDVEPVKMLEDAKIVTSELEVLTGAVDNELIREHAKDEIEPIVSHYKHEH